MHPSTLTTLGRPSLSKPTDTMAPQPFKGFPSTYRPHVPPLYRVAATGLGASMWFFLMYRAKKDGAVLMGWKHPWDH
ncbi:unnamed protein product [Discula destructiva]